MCSSIFAVVPPLPLHRNRRKRHARPAESAHPVDNSGRSAGPVPLLFANTQISSRTRRWEARVRLETCALAKNGEAGSSSPAQHFLYGGVRRRLSSAVVADADAVSRPGCGRGGPGPPAPSGRSWDFSGEKGSLAAAAFEEVTGGAPSSSTSTDPGYGASEEGARETGDMAR